MITASTPSSATQLEVRPAVDRPERDRQAQLLRRLHRLRRAPDGDQRKVHLVVPVRVRALARPRRPAATSRRAARCARAGRRTSCGSSRAASGSKDETVTAAFPAAAAQDVGQGASGPRGDGGVGHRLGLDDDPWADAARRRAPLHGATSELGQASQRARRRSATDRQVVGADQRRRPRRATRRPRRRRRPAQGLGHRGHRVLRATLRRAPPVPEDPDPVAPRVRRRERVIRQTGELRAGRGADAGERRRLHGARSVRRGEVRR